MLDERWTELEAKGVALLRDPRKIPKAPAPGNRQFILQLWNHPSFDSWTSLTVFSPWHGQTDSALVRRAIWDRQADVGVMADPVNVARKRGSTEPTVHVADAAIDWKTVRAWRLEFSRLRIPLVHEGPLGCDGESKGFRYGDATLALEFKWREGGPKEWKGFLRLLEKIRENCEMLFGS